MTTDTSTGRESTEQMKEEGSRLGEEARAKGGEVGRQARHEFGRVVDDARSRARDQAEDQTHRAAGAMRNMAGQLDSMARGAEERGSMVDLVESGAERMRRMADDMDERGIDGLVHDIQTFARRRPGVFIAAGVGLGMVLGRILRSADLGGMKEAVQPESTEPEMEEGSAEGRLGPERGVPPERQPMPAGEFLEPEPATVRASERREGPGGGVGI